MDLRVSTNEEVKRCSGPVDKSAKCDFCRTGLVIAKVERGLKDDVSPQQQSLCANCLIVLDKNNHLTNQIASGEPVTPRSMQPDSVMASRARLYRVSSSASQPTVVSVTRVPLDLRSLRSANCYVLDCQTIIFIWKGANTLCYSLYLVRIAIAFYSFERYCFVIVGAVGGRFCGDLFGGDDCVGKYAAKNVVNRSAYLGVQLGRVDRGEVQIVDDGAESAPFTNVFDAHSLLVPSAKASAAVTLSDEPPSQHILYRVQGRVDIAAKGDRIDFRQLSNRFAFILDTTDRFGIGDGVASLFQRLLSTDADDVVFFFGLVLTQRRRIDNWRIREPKLGAVVGTTCRFLTVLRR
jgi:hypothetical protein